MSTDYKAEVKLYTTPWCPYCVRAKGLLKRKNVPFEDFNVASDPQLRRQIVERTGKTSVPQIFINDQPIGGCDELHTLEAIGQLDQMLAVAPS